ncbi:MAG: 3-phosphoglycerate dehydrogenase [Candidatus Neomarinimicrobiota bacterium]|nr:MAG: 3-phosphoglycerate dehydrogenase [Candidatus Neomarinimicrobiota bacterium]
MKILITDGISPFGQEILRDNGIDFDIQHYEHDELLKVIPEYDGILVRSATKVPKDIIDAGKNLKLIARGGTGIDNIDHQYAKSKGIPVLNTPGANSASVSELVFAHMFALARFIPQANITMRKGEWNKKSYKGVELKGKTLGIVGFGKIGQITANMALSLGMSVLAYDLAEIKTDLDIKIVSKEELLKESDFITLHVPKQAQNFITKAEFELMKPTVFLINTSRGGVVNEEDLLEALNNGKIAGAGIDAFLNEPTPNPELVNHPKVSCTPHIGASTKEAQDRVGIQIAEKIVAVLNQ